jgi:hypothetical protein
MSTQASTDLPNLGGHKLNLHSNDESQSIRYGRASDIATGKVAMPFRHPEFAFEYYKNRNDPVGIMMQMQFKIISSLARIRNIRLMKKCNVEIAKHSGKRLFEITDYQEKMVNNLGGYLKNRIQTQC